MPSPNEKLAESLDELKALQQGNQRVFRSDDLSRFTANAWWRTASCKKS